MRDLIFHFLGGGLRFWGFNFWIKWRIIHIWPNSFLSFFLSFRVLSPPRACGFLAARGSCQLRSGAHCQGSSVAPRPHTPVGMTLSPHSSSESLDVGWWGLKPLSPCFTPPAPVIQPRFSSSSYHPHPFLSQVRRRALSARDWWRTGDSYALGRGFREARARDGAGVAGRHPPAGAGGGHSRGLLPAARAARTRVLANGRQVR